jgi:two-component system response regulator NreC
MARKRIRPARELTRDLIAFSALPATWAGREPLAIEAGAEPKNTGPARHKYGKARIDPARWPALPCPRMDGQNGDGAGDLIGAAPWRDTGGESGGARGRKSQARTRARRAKIRVLVVDDQATPRATLRAAIAAQADMAVAGEAATGPESARAARRLQPDVAVVNVAVPPARVVEEVEAVLRACPRALVLVVNMQDDLPLLGSALTAGAADCLVRKPSAGDVDAALQAVRRVVLQASRDGERAEAAPAEKGRSVRGGSVLSRRERQVLELLARGYARREIAERLGIGVKSIETYRSRVAEKLGAQTRADLVRYALDSGLLGTRAR